MSKKHLPLLYMMLCFISSLTDSIFDGERSTLSSLKSLFGEREPRRVKVPKSEVSRGKIKDEYIFSLDRAEYIENLEEGEVPKKLKDKFEEEGYDIGENTQLSKEEGEWWIIEKEEKKYKINDPLLFSFNHLNYEIYFEEAPVPVHLANKFKREGHPLEGDAYISKDNSEWWITVDGRKEYKLEEEHMEKMLVFDGDAVNGLDVYERNIIKDFVVLPSETELLEGKPKDEISDYTEMPPLEDESKEIVEINPVREPFSYSRIVYDEEEKEYIYQAIEPTLTEEENKMFEKIKDTLDRALSYEWKTMEKKDKESFIREAVKSYLESRNMDLEERSRERILYHIVRDYVRFGPLDVVMSDEYVEDMSCDGTNIPIFIYHSKYESIKTDIKFEKEERLNSYIIQLGQRCGKQVSVSNPILDGTTSEGHRVQATYADEVSTRGSSITIRRFKKEPFTPVKLIKYNTASPQMVAYLWLMVENEKSSIVAGGTACGKTATLNSMTLFIPPGLKIVSLEDTREINLPHENWIPSTTRAGTTMSQGEGKDPGEVNMYDLVRNALRQRPDYIIVGEVRGKEAHDMFQAMATGHVTYSTMHADSVQSMVHRLENPPINCPRVLLTALNFVIIQTFARIDDEEVRRIQEITEIVAFEPESDELITNTVFEWERSTDSYKYKGHTYNFDEIMTTKNWTQEEMDEEFENRTEIIKYLVEENLSHYKDISKVITSYYKEPEETLARIREKRGEGDE